MGGKLVLSGIGVAPGLAVGTAVFHDREEVDVPVLSLNPEHVEPEQRRLTTAIDEVRERLHEVERNIEREVGSQDARILSVQRLLLEDPSFAKGIAARIAEDLVNAEVAIRDEIHAWQQRFAAVSADRDPASDLRDVGRQLQRVLAGQGPETLAGAGDRVILVTQELLPSDAARLDRQHLAAIVTAAGGVASHAAILARGLGIPAVTGVDVGSLPARGGRWVVDGTHGTVTVNPSTEDLERAERESADYTAFRASLVETTRGLAHTSDGVGVELMLNVENFEEVPAALLDGIHGIGLYRTEFLFMNRNTFPSEEEQFQHYVDALAAIGDREITFRTIDVGGDKPLSYLNTPHEPNPVLGWRGMRLSLQWPDLLYTQFRALLRASARGRMRVMVPMITMVEEFRRARDIFEEVRADLARRDVPMADHVAFGAMVEVPAAALAAGSLAIEADFLAIGTNDLSQYALAVDRNNARVSELYQPLHPGVLALVRSVLDAAYAADRPVCLCGEMAGDPEAALLLIGLGLRSFSMSPYHLPVVRRMIGRVSVDEARRITSEVLELATTTEIRAALRAHALRLAPELAAVLETANPPGD